MPTSFLLLFHSPWPLPTFHGLFLSSPGFSCLNSLFLLLLSMAVPLSKGEPLDACGEEFRQGTTSTASWLTDQQR